ncbi:FAD-dependent monooxygenase [Actinomadura roseirufa]|uniref:FAD-dependent monooxygenase n=1 Tax=Actinomadura roseirufa TaxID=2094049 RepID=UPI0010414508|nr:FAD-dependent monooxygenase [Actinomadura roseirufa]
MGRTREPLDRGPLDAEVVIVGAGPAGLMLAGELRTAGVSVIVVDRLAGPLRETRASQLNTRTAEIFHARGLDGLLAEAQPEPKAHFGGLTFDLSRVDSAYAGNWKVPQYRTEAALTRRARGLGAVVLRPFEVRGLDDAGDHVAVQVDGPDGGRTLRAAFAVGCDGEDGAVRGLAGFAFPGAAATRELLRADVTGLAVRDRRFERLEHGLAVAATRRGVTRVMVHAFGRAPVPRDRPPAFAEIAELWSRVTGEDISGGRPVWTDAFGNAHGQVTAYRRGRVLLAGDAAHRHLPIGGQSLNIALQDAVNLGWRLAAAVRGAGGGGGADGEEPGESVLDGYHAERHPVGARVLRFVLAQEALLLGGPEVTPMRTVLAELLAGEAARDHIAGLVSGLDVRYGTGRHPLVGRRVPEVELRIAGRGAVSTSRLWGEGRGVLIRLPGSPHAGAEAVALASGRWPRLTVVDAAPPEPAPVTAPAAEAFGGLRSLLLRPDGHVAWADGEDGDLAGALRRCFGPPRLESRRDERRTA